MKTRVFLGESGGVAAYLKTIINYHFYTRVTKMSCFGFIFFKHKHFKVKKKQQNNKIRPQTLVKFKKSEFPSFNNKTEMLCGSLCVEKEALMGAKCVFQPSILAEHVLAAVLTVTTLPAALHSSPPLLLSPRRGVPFLPNFPRKETDSFYFEAKEKRSSRLRHFLLINTTMCCPLCLS